LVYIDSNSNDESDTGMLQNTSIADFVNQGGKAISFKCNEIDNCESDLRLIKSKLVAKFDQKFIADTCDQDNCNPFLTEGYLISSDSNVSIDQSMLKKINEDPNSPVSLMTFKEFEAEKMTTLYSKIPIIIDCNYTKISSDVFNFPLYFKHLTSKLLGHKVVFNNVVTTTMTTIDAFSFIPGVVAIANQQTEGRGRQNNQWISPKGCAMFSSCFEFSLNSKMGQNLGLVQHLISLAEVESILSKPGYENLSE